MIAKELLARNPTIREAIAYVERYADFPALGKAVAQGTDAAGLVRCLADVIDESVAEDRPPNAAELRLTQAQRQQNGRMR